MPKYTSPEVVVQRQLDAYNARDLEAWLSTFADDAKQFLLEGELLAQGHSEIRDRARSRFSELNLQATLIRRMVMGNIVIDHEDVTRTFQEGPGRIEFICIYRVEDGKIQSGTYSIGPQILFPNVLPGAA